MEKQHKSDLKLQKGNNMVEFFIAKKHIIERKKQSLISIVGITIGIIVLIVSIGIANGLDKNMINSILSVTSHIVVSNVHRLPRMFPCWLGPFVQYQFAIACAVLVR